MTSVETIRQSTRNAMAELLDLAKVREGQLFVVGCSTSEIVGKKIGTDSHLDVAQVVFDEIYNAVKAKGLNLAIQCCEHINRALVMDRSAMTWEEEVNVVPQRHAGGALAVMAYEHFDDPVMVEFIQADVGIDIGDTFHWYAHETRCSACTSLCERNWESTCDRLSCSSEEHWR